MLEILANFFMNYCATRSVYELAEEDAMNNHSLFQEHNNGQLTYEVDFISHERLALIHLFVVTAKSSLEMSNDSYLEFSALILLDNLF